jgi:hypothetical protein
MFRLVEAEELRWTVTAVKLSIATAGDGVAVANSTHGCSEHPVAPTAQVMGAA